MSSTTLKRVFPLLLFLELLLSGFSFATENRILHPQDLWGQDNAKYRTEHELIKTLFKAAGPTQHPIFAPSLLIASTDPKVAVLIASLGGDGDHSYEYSWVFTLGESEPVPFAKQIPFAISNVWWTAP